MTKIKTNLSHVVIDVRHATADKVIVLCKLPNNSVTPYVTWRIDQDGNAFLGHYFSSISDACKDFVSR